MTTLAQQKIINKRIYERNRLVINDLKSRPCHDCGGVFHRSAMDFDHVHGTKRFNLGDLGTRSLKTLQAEIEKCEVVCANCHRLRTFKRYGERKGLD